MRSSGPPRADEVLVELRFGGVNPVDRYVAEGRVAPDGPLPRILGGEASGVLEGRDVLVAGGGLGASRDGCWAQAAVVPAALVVDLPEGVDLRDAAAMGVAGLTAYKIVRELAAVSAYDRVLVLGASGGVGSMIVSLASSASATVWGQTGSAEKAGLIEVQGAERVIVAGPEQLAEAFGHFQPRGDRGAVRGGAADGCSGPDPAALVSGRRWSAVGGWKAPGRARQPRPGRQVRGGPPRRQRAGRVATGPQARPDGGVVVKVGGRDHPRVGGSVAARRPEPEG